MRHFTFVSMLVAAVALSACKSDLGCDAAAPRTVQVYEPETRAAAPACASCAGGACTAPERAPAPLGLVGDYGIELGQPGVEEHARALLAVLPDVTDCGITFIDDVLHAGVKAARCALDRIVPRPAASQRLVRLQVVAAPAKAAPAGPCGR